MIAWIDRSLERFRSLNVAVCNDSWKGDAFPARFKWGLGEGLARLTLFTLRELLRPSHKAPRCRLLIGIGSRNNEVSARAAFDGMEDACFFSFHTFNRADMSRLNLFLTYLTGWPVILLLPVLLYREKKLHVRKAMLIRLDHLALSYGSCANIRRYLRSSGADIFVTASNLSIYNNLLVREARRIGMKTVFITHAPVGRGQEPLATDIALLDGEFQKTLYPPSRTKLIVTGSMRGRELARHRQDRADLRGVLIATNSLLRDLGRISTFIRILKKRYPALEIVLRPHPADVDRLHEHREICADTAATFADPSRPLYESAARCRYLVTGLSGVAVDALLIGLSPLILRSPELDAVTANLPPDYYGLYELGLAGTIDLYDPVLTDRPNMAGRIGLLEASYDPDWNTAERIRAAINLVRAERLA